MLRDTSQREASIGLAGRDLRPRHGMDASKAMHTHASRPLRFMPRPARAARTSALLAHVETLPQRAPRSMPLTVGVAVPLTARLKQARRPGTFDYILLLAVVTLLLLGLIMVYSASQFAVRDDPGHWFRHQVVWAMLGGGALLLTSQIHYRTWRRYARAGMILSVVLLLLVLFFGHTTYGAQRWLHIGPLSMQPSELAKLCLIIYIADWLVHMGDSVRTLVKGLLPFAALTGLVLFLILLQNDMGTSLVVAALAVAMFFAAGANLLQLLPSLGVGATGFFLLALRGFRRARLDAFLHPLPPGCADAASYQLCQGLISLGSGGIFGRGLGDSVQKAGYLPNPFTDSIFAVTGEELGLVGCTLILGLFALLAFRGLRIGRRAPDPFGALLACGITCWLVAQAAINIGSVANAIPFTGVPLPFVSFGGSSLVTSLAAVGILLNISRHTTRPAQPDTQTPAQGSQ